MRKIRIAMLQLLVEYSKPAGNLERAGVLLRQAKAQGAELAVLPECFDLGWANPEAETLAQPIPGTYSGMLCALAGEVGIAVCAGLTERDHNRIYNTAVLVDKSGRIVGQHRKINTLTEVEPMYAVGTALQVFETDLGRIGVAICADNAPDSTALGEALCRMGAQIILSPCSWAVEPDFQAAYYGHNWYRAYSRLAKLYGVPVVGVSNVGVVTAGVWKGWSCIGNSIALFADGVSGVTLPYGVLAETMRVIDVPLRRDGPHGTALAADVAEKKRALCAQAGDLYVD